MVKSYKFRETLKEYRNSILIGSGVLLSLVALTSTIHHAIVLVTVLFLLGVFAYLLIWE